MLEPGYVNETTPCPRLTCALARVGDKWSIQIVMQLEAGPVRFNTLKRATVGISQKMLAATLRALERDGFVSRTVYATKPPSVEYALTELGLEMVAPVRALGMWVAANLDRIERAQARFDKRRS